MIAGGRNWLITFLSTHGKQITGSEMILKGGFSDIHPAARLYISKVPLPSVVI